MSVLPPHSTRLENQLERTTERITNHRVPLRMLWDPQTCPASHLPWLAWAFSVDHWNSDWPESVKRRVIAQSITLHRRKGTPAAIKDALAALNIQFHLREWWEQTPQGTPHTFTITLVAENNLRPQSHSPQSHSPQARSMLPAHIQENTVIAVNASKPARSHFTVLASASPASRLGLGVAQQCSQKMKAAITSGVSGVTSAMVIAAAQSISTRLTAHMEVT